jgi:hypothetical protein
VYSSQQATSPNRENHLKDFCKAFEEGNAEAIEEQFNNYLMKTISIRDTFTTKKENFYHGVLLGLLSYDPDWYITSNQESGEMISVLSRKKKAVCQRLSCSCA